MPSEEALRLAVVLAWLGDPTADTLTSLVAKLGDPALTIGAMNEDRENIIKFTSAGITEPIVLGGDQNTTELQIVVALPTGATIVRSMLTAFITIMNNTATAHKINLNVEGRLGGGAWNDYFDQDEVCGFPASDGATTGHVANQDVSALVNAAGTYGFRLTVNQSGGANSVRYTTWYLLTVTYRMS